MSPDRAHVLFGPNSTILQHMDEAPADDEPHFVIELKNVTEFASALEIVRYANKDKTTQGYQDVILIAEKRGIHLKATAKSGSIISTVQIKPKVFQKYEFYWPPEGQRMGKENLAKNENSANRPDQTAELQEQLLAPTVVKPLEEKIEFCIPYHELRHIVECHSGDSTLTLIYPMRDQKLGAIIEDHLTLGPSNLGKNVVSKQPQKIAVQQMFFDVYDGQDPLDFSYDFASHGMALNVFSTVKHFKNALKEFQPYDDSVVVKLRIQTQMPRISFTYEYGNFVQKISFREDVEQFRILESSDAPFEAHYTLESLRLGLSRDKNADNVLALNVNMNGVMSAKIMPETKNFLASSLILPQQFDDE